MENPSLVIRFFMTDLASVLVILFWADLTVSILLFSYVFQLEDERNRKLLLRFTQARWVQTLAWALFVIISKQPGLTSMIVGTTLLFSGFYLETRSLFTFTALPKRLTQGILDVMAICAIGGLLISYIAFGKNEERVLLFGLFACLIILLPGPVSLLRTRKSPLQVAIGLGYGLLVIAIVMQLLQMSLPFLPRVIPPLLLSDLVKLLFVEVTMIGGMGILLLTKQEADQRILDLAFRDPLTGLHNRRFFGEEARAVLRDSMREKREIALAFLDIDHFKKINDTFGHHFGDTVLRDFSAIMKMETRPLDRSCRYGGEEFLILLPGTDKEGALAVVGRILELVRASRFKSQPDFSYTVSAGVFVGIPEANSVDELQRMIDAADSALYAAKHAGRNRIELYSDAKAV